MLKRTALRAFVMAVPVHFVWEMSQMRLFTGVPNDVWRSTLLCGRASVGDGVLTVVILAIGTVLFGTPAWVKRPGWRPGLVAVGLSLAIAVVMEWVNVHGLARWGYATDMVIIPGLGIGLTPVLQMPVLTPPILWWASRHARGRKADVGR